MELQLVSFDQAKALKELGFPQLLNENIHCIYIYDLLDYCEDCSTLEFDENITYAPTLELAAKFFRQEMQLFIHIDYDFNDNEKPYKCEVCKVNGMTCNVGWFKDYDESLSSAIDKCIELLTDNELQILYNNR